MKVLHIIPAAFEYFDDIREKAMNLMENERRLGVEVEAFTLQYGTVSSKEKKSFKRISPGSDFIGLFSGDKALSSFAEFDLIHIHLPTLGLISKIIKWKQAGDTPPVVITYWRDVVTTDLFSHFVRWYNYKYCRSLYSVADVLICFNLEEFLQTNFFRRLKNRDIEKIINLEDIKMEFGERSIHLTNEENKLKLINTDMEASACISVYDMLINK